MTAAVIAPVRSHKGIATVVGPVTGMPEISVVAKFPVAGNPDAVRSWHGRAVFRLRRRNRERNRLIESTVFVIFGVSKSTAGQSADDPSDEGTLAGAGVAVVADDGARQGTEGTARDGTPLSVGTSCVAAGKQDRNQKEDGFVHGKG